MQTRLAPQILATDAGREADEILRACVHCGFCTATCPTYVLDGNELDSPRGRIWLIKDMLEEDAAPQLARTHLDRCLTCRACETTCPSGVRYGRLLEIGREHLHARRQRPWRERLLRWWLRMVVPYPARFRPLLRMGQWLRPVLPRALRDKVPLLQTRPPRAPAPREHRRHVVLLRGCVQSLATPATDRALVRVLDALDIGARVAHGSGCCGALPHHLDDVERSRQLARRNLDAWWPMLQDGVEALLVSASGCGVHVKDYGTLLADDPDYAERARHIAERTRDPAEFLADEALDRWRLPRSVRVAWHPPCTLQHGQRITGVVEALLDGIGAQRTPVAEAHLCCGSAGTYSLLEPDRAGRLRERKLAALISGRPELVATANVGCQVHLAGAAELPVKHWLELLAEAIPAASADAHGEDAGELAERSS